MRNRHWLWSAGPVLGLTAPNGKLGLALGISGLGQSVTEIGSGFGRQALCAVVVGPSTYGTGFGVCYGRQRVLENGNEIEGNWA